MAKKKGKNKGYTYRYNRSGTVTCRAYFDMPNETSKQLSATGRTEEESRKELKAKYAEICKQGKQIKSNGYTVKTWSEYWLENVKTNLKGNTKDSYYFSFKNHIYPILSNVKLKDLTLDHIQKAVNKVKVKKVIKNGLSEQISGKAVKEIFAPFKQALHYAMADNKMAYISLELLDMPKVKKGTREVRSMAEQKIITDYFCNKIPNKPFNLYYAPVAVMDSRGIRPEECGGLQWQDIDYEKDSFWAGRHTVVKNGVYDKDGKKIGDKLVVEDSGKTPQAERELPLGTFLSNIFKMKYQEYLNKGITPKPTDFIFYTKAGNPFYEQSLRKMYKSLAKKLGISEIGCYSLRHEFATFLAQIEKADYETIKQLMGWSEIVPTYFHTDDDNKYKAITQIDSQFITNTHALSSTIEVDAKSINCEISQKDNVIFHNFGNVINQ